ncbi:addiction module antidote protein [Mesorhizobium australicum]|uniref:Probable addiction module antidote protein n=1 Tax=Mesorhizobium australicum TaxID=536018 RepID=A0A1X7P0W5_9HYPH|nr:addiction module antidote protein [Mesorhizobium australicum]SMH43509.1 probable addiction module antidote protein [Mesorhizobium australicum]
MALETLPFDAAEYIDDDLTAAEYLKATCEDGNPNEIALALGTIARARNMTKLAEQTGLSRQALYKALSGEGNPEFATIMKVADALGLRLTFVSADKNRDAA